MIRVTSAVDEDARPAKRARTAKDSNNESDLAISTSKSTSSIAKRSLDRHGSLYNEVRDLALTKSKSESKFNARNSEYHNGFDLQSLGWATLPHIILERIFLFLKERHRVKAMFVCKRWYTVMRNSASLWRIKSFRFSGRDPRDSTNIPYRKATQFVRTFGKYLRSLEFRLYNPANSAICRKFQKAIRVCFISLIKDKTKLRQLAIPGLQFDRGQWTASEEDFAAWLSKYFCKGQHTLEKVNLRGAKMSLNDGYKVLFSLGYDMAESMRYLDIEDFFHSRRPIYVFTEFVDCLRQFRYLQELYINYSYVSEDLLETMADNLAPNALKRLHIKVHIHDAHDQIILGQSWQALREKCPDCRVDMIFNRVLSSEEHFRILCPQIPLRQVTFDGCYFADQDWQIGPTITTILPHYKSTLEKITLDLPDTYEIFENQLLALIEHCAKLYYLKINAFISTRFVEKVLVMRESLKCSIDTLKVRMYVRDFHTNAEEIDLERIYNAHRTIINEQFYDYQVDCCISL